ncbi:MAG TPA: ABC transporter permease subunit [Chloroflexota bacterium]|nr:ABC transporter permease subunit [Chloroflexota bacterium]
MDFLAALGAWLADPAHWQGSDGIPTRVAEHVLMSAVTIAVAMAVAAPIGVWLGHLGRGGFVVLNVANVGRALPSLALLALLLPLALALGLGLGFWPTFLAILPLGIPPILTNAYVAVREVDRDLLDAARGQGLDEWQVLRQAELPLATPLIVAGIRGAAVTVVATVTLGALVASGGLGRYIVDGLARHDNARLVVGAVLVAALAIATEAGFGLIERRAIPVGLRAQAGERGPSP